MTQNQETNPNWSWTKCSTEFCCGWVFDWRLMKGDTNCAECGSSTRWIRRSRSKVARSRSCAKRTTPSSESWSRSSRRGTRYSKSCRHPTPTHLSSWFSRSRPQRNRPRTLNIRRRHQKTGVADKTALLYYCAIIFSVDHQLYEGRSRVGRPKVTNSNGPRRCSRSQQHPTWSQFSRSKFVLPFAPPVQEYVASLHSM